MSSTHLPPAEPPDDAIALALEELAVGRAELREASRVLSLLALPSGRSGPLYLRKRAIELRVAEFAVRQWSDEVRRLEAAVRALGLRP